MIVNIHGFESSGENSKYKWLKENYQCEIYSPTFDYRNTNPRIVLKTLRDKINAVQRADASEPVCIVGSSLGGFYAGRLANITGAPVVLLNPCLNPWAFVQSETGEQTIFGTERRISVAEHFAEDFRSLADAVSPVPTALERTLAILSTADEVLDWRLAWQSLQGAGIVLSAGDDHRISRFAAFVPEILRFAAPNHAVNESR